MSEQMGLSKDKLNPEHYARSRASVGQLFSMTPASLQCTEEEFHDLAVQMIRTGGGQSFELVRPEESTTSGRYFALYCRRTA
jgi:hypothetical protein